MIKMNFINLIELLIIISFFQKQLSIGSLFECLSFLHLEGCVSLQLVAVQRLQSDQGKLTNLHKLSQTQKGLQSHQIEVFMLTSHFRFDQ